VSPKTDGFQRQTAFKHNKKLPLTAYQTARGQIRARPRNSNKKKGSTEGSKRKKPKANLTQENRACSSPRTNRSCFAGRTTGRGLPVPKTNQHKSRRADCARPGQTKPPKGRGHAAKRAKKKTGAGTPHSNNKKGEGGKKGECLCGQQAPTNELRSARPATDKLEVETRHGQKKTNQRKEGGQRGVNQSTPV